MFEDLFIDHGTIARCRLPQTAPKALYLDTTNIYAQIDLEMKAKAMALGDGAETGPDRPWNANERLMAFLGALRLKEIMLRICGRLSCPTRHSGPSAT